jgi:BirA family transcriptional regulator, biotin operon repressor / biotin---[acetyl-CoA-carboxylase] ligase
VTHDWPVGVGRIVLDSVDSTNSEAMRRAADTPIPTWIMTRVQTAGRGRRGRNWLSPEGNFFASLLLPVSGPPGQVALHSFVAALALRDAFVALTGREDLFTLKWPNDVLLRGGKVAGILLESSGQAVRHLCIGIGVNLRAAPEADTLEADAVPAKSLKAETGVSATPEDFLDLLAPAFVRRKAQLASHGFEPIRQGWLAHAARLGEVITARTGNRRVTGIFETVDAQGAVVLKATDGRHSITAADIFFT